MRNTWKIAFALTLVLGLRGATAQAQPLITGNTSAFGCGPIYTSDFTLGTTVDRVFIPTGAGGDPCTPNSPPNINNGRGLAVGGTEIFYTEITGSNGFGPTDVIRIAPFNNGTGGPDARTLIGGATTLPNPRPGSGIQALTFAGGNLYVLTGYDTEIPIVYKISLINGAVLAPTAGITIAQPGGTDRGVDGFAVLNNGNFLMNNGDASCIYSEYDKSTGALIGNTINVPGGPIFCTGVDTDGTSLFFMTDFNSISRTDFAGNMTGYNTFSDGDELVEDISIIHPVTIITDVADGHLWLGLKDSDDQGTNYDLKTELLLNGSPVTGAVAVTRCITGLTRSPTFAKDVLAQFPAFGDTTLVSGDVLAFRFSTRIGTRPDDTKCPSSHNNADGLKLYYDSPGRASHVPITIAPDVETKYYLHSDGGGCPPASSGGSAGVTTPTLDKLAPLPASAKCAVSGNVDFNGGNLYSLIGTWSLAAQP